MARWIPTPHQVIRHVDGIPHVVLGPPMLIWAGDVARFTGVDRRLLVPVLVAFTAYGAVALVGSREGKVPRWLLALAVAANLAFAALVGASLAFSPLTVSGRWMHLFALAGAASVIALLLPGHPASGGCARKT